MNFQLLVDIPINKHNGSEFGIVWRDTPGIDDTHFARFDSNGDQIGGNMTVAGTTNNSLNPAIAATSDGWGVLWYEQYSGSWHDLMFAQLDSSGTPVVGPVNLTNHTDGTRAINPAMFWTGSGFRILWKDTRAGVQTLTMGIDTNGVAQDTTVALGDADAGWSPAVAWSGTHYLAVWSNSTGSQISMTSCQ